MGRGGSWEGAFVRANGQMCTRVPVPVLRVLQYTAIPGTSRLVYLVYIDRLIILTRACMYLSTGIRVLVHVYPGMPQQSSRFSFFLSLPCVYQSRYSVPDGRDRCELFVCTGINVCYTIIKIRWRVVCPLLYRYRYV